MLSKFRLAWRTPRKSVYGTIRSNHVGIPRAKAGNNRGQRYADKYRHLGEPVHLVAVEFSKDTRNLTAFEVVPA